MLEQCTVKEGMHGERCYHNINKYGGVNLTINFSDSDSPLPLVTLHVVKSKNTRQSHKTKQKKKKKKKTSSVRRDKGNVYGQCVRIARGPVHSQEFCLQPHMQGVRTVLHWWFTSLLSFETWWRPNGRNVVTNLSRVDAVCWSEESSSSANNKINKIKMAASTCLATVTIYCPSPKPWRAL